MLTGRTPFSRLTVYTTSAAASISENLSYLKIYASIFLVKLRSGVAGEESPHFSRKMLPREEVNLFEI